MKLDHMSSTLPSPMIVIDQLSSLASHRGHIATTITALGFALSLIRALPEYFRENRFLKEQLFFTAPAIGSREVREVADSVGSDGGRGSNIFCFVSF